jgi:hypothetical protein
MAIMQEITGLASGGDEGEGYSFEGGEGEVVEGSVNESFDIVCERSVEGGKPRQLFYNGTLHLNIYNQTNQSMFTCTHIENVEILASIFPREESS